MNKVLLTGATGFIGSYFVHKYASKYNLDQFSFLRDDLQSLNLSKVVTVVHLSALVHQMSGSSQTEYEKINVTQTLDLAKKAKQSGVRQFIFMSTIKVYGEETDLVYNETTPCHPRDHYGASKLKAEQELLQLEDDNFQVIIIRTPIVYGYGVKANIYNLIQLIQKIPILPFKGVQNRRSMIYIGNLCHMIDEIIQQRKEGIFLASDDEPVSLSQLIELIAKNLGKKVYLVKIPFLDKVVKYLKPSVYQRLYKNLEVDNTHTKKILNLKNPYTLQEGIKYMIKGEKV